MNDFKTDQLIKILGRPPECMHPPDDIVEHKESWTCMKCKKSYPKILKEHDGKFNVLSGSITINFNGKHDL